MLNNFQQFLLILYNFTKSTIFGAKIQIIQVNYALKNSQRSLLV